MRSLLALALLIAVEQAMPAGGPDDFAYGYRLELDGEAPVYELAVPDAVYRGITRDDLGDVRVFNAAGEPVPYVLRSPPTASEEARVVGLPVFPLHSAPGRAAENLAVVVETRENGAVIRVRREDARRSRLSGYLLDASALDRPLDALRLQLADDDAELIAQVRVEASDDLHGWRTVVAGATIARLAYAEHRLQQSSVPLPGVRERYLRLSWPDPGSRVELAGVEATLRQAAVEPDRHRLELEGRPASGTARAFEYDTGGRFPVDQLRLALPANALAFAEVSSRAGPGAPWRPRHQGVHYHLRIGGAELTSEPATFPPVQDRYWRIEIRDGGYTGTTPLLHLGWAAQRLAFLAAGEPPYLLAYGSAGARPGPAPLEGVLATLGTARGSALVRPARLGDAVTLGGSARLLPGATAVDWKRVLLWGVLLAGVVILAAMAWRLRTQLSAEGRGAG